MHIGLFLYGFVCMSVPQSLLWSTIITPASFATVFHSHAADPVQEIVYATITFEGSDGVVPRFLQCSQRSHVFVVLLIVRFENSSLDTEGGEPVLILPAQMQQALPDAKRFG